MRGAVECHAFELTISVALIGIREPGKPGISENDLHGCFSIEKLTDILYPRSSSDARLLAGMDTTDSLSRGLVSVAAL
jgi:hypothetical protein